MVDRPANTLRIDDLIGTWTTFWNTELVIVVIPNTPIIGQRVGTVGYLYNNEINHCGIDIWYGGFDGIRHKFNAQTESADYVPVIGKTLRPCNTIGIKPFSNYEITFEAGEITLIQIDDGRANSPLVLTRAND